MDWLRNKKERFFNKLKQNNRGSSFVLVLVSIALIMILVAVIFVMIFMQYRMVSLGRQSKDNFYYLEEVLEEMRAGVGNESVVQLKKAYDETVEMVVFYNTDHEKYMSVSDETATGIMNNKYFTNLENTFKIGSDELQKLLLSYVANMDTSGTETKDGVKITFSSTFDLQKLETTNPQQTIGYSMTGITVSRTDKNGNEQSITTDISIYPPEEALNFLGSGTDIENVFTYAMVADYGIEVNTADAHVAESNVRINGNVYAANDRRNNGVYGATATTSASGNATALTGGKAYDQPSTTTNSSKYSGICVVGENSKLDMQSDMVAVNGSINSDNGGEISTNTKSESSNQSGMSNLWAENILVTSTDDSIDGGTITLNANASLSDDVELDAPNSNVTLNGILCAYNYAAEEDDYEKALNSYKSDSSYSESNNPLSSINDTTASDYRKHTNSSAIIVNGEKSVLDLSHLTELVVNGTSYIDLVSERPSDTDESDIDSTVKADSSKYSNVDIQTAESISLKGTQLVYRVVESGVVSSTLKALDTTLNRQVGNDTEKLSTGVPTYNMIKFLTYQFFQDGGYKIYQNGVNGSADWSGVAFNSYSEIWSEMTSSTNIENNAYYIDIMRVYFPTNKKITANGDGTFSEVSNDKTKVTDLYGNTYEIYKNDDFVQTDKNQKEIGIHRYGFITVGKDYNLLNLVRTVTGEDKDTYYFYQFYDNDAKEEFVEDYAAYTSEVAAIEDVLSPELFEGTIELPDLQGTSRMYTRGISTVIDSDSTDTQYKLIKSNSTDDVDANDKDEVEVMKEYSEKVLNAKYHMAYLAKTEPMDTNSDQAKVQTAKTLFEANGKNISPLTNEDSMNINWAIVADKPASYRTGVELEGYTGAKVWVSKDDIVIDGTGSSSQVVAGIVLCQGNVTFRNVDFTGTVIAAGKVFVQGTCTFTSDEQMCNNMFQNDKDNMIRSCFGLSALKESTKDSDGMTSVSSIEYTDLVGFENYIKNGEE